MPTVGKKKFPYTKKGKAAAKKMGMPMHTAAMEKKHKPMMKKKPKMMYA